MAFMHKENEGSLFRNKKKPPGSSQPDMRGEINIHGALFELAGWTRESKDKTQKFLSLKIKPKEVYEGHRPPPSNDDDSDIPF